MRPQQKQLFRAAVPVLFALALPAFAAGTDELWEVTVKMEMAGMPMAMPAQTNRICQPKDRPQEEGMMPADQNCKMTDVKRSGNKSSFKLSCTGEQAMTGSGEFEHNGDNYRGTMRMATVMDGESFDMTQNISAKKVGNCTYEDLGKKMMAQHQAQVDDTCRSAVDKLEWAVFKNDAVEICKPFKKDFCAKVDKLAAELRTPAGFASFTGKRSDWREVLGTCGVAADPIIAAACDAAQGPQDVPFIAQYCPAKAQALAAQHCVGRSYTAAMSGPYGQLCRGQAAQQVPVTTPAGAVQQGVNSLKKLLPF